MWQRAYHRRRCCCGCMRISSEQSWTASCWLRTTAAMRGTRGTGAIFAMASGTPPALTHPKGRECPAMPRSLWWSIAPKPHVVRVACPYQRSNCGCSSACIRPSEPRETLEVAHAGCWDNTLPSPMHYSLYGKSPSRDVDDRQNISSTSRASPAVFSPHWWQVCLGQVWP
jgi:hypothetical protein